MNEVTSELREFAQKMDWNDSHCDNYARELKTIADHIDGQTVQLPVDAESRIWHAGDLSDVGEVLSLSLRKTGWKLRVTGQEVEPELHHHCDPSPSMRIRKCAQWLESCYKQHGTLDSAVLNELYDIAEDLDCEVID